VPAKSAGKKAQRVDKECRQKGAACRQRVPAKSPDKKGAACRQKRIGQKNAVLTKAPSIIGLLRRKK